MDGGRDGGWLRRFAGGGTRVPVQQGLDYLAYNVLSRVTRCWLASYLLLDALEDKESTM